MWAFTVKICENCKILNISYPFLAIIFINFAVDEVTHIKILDFTQIFDVLIVTGEVMYLMGSKIYFSAV